MGMLLGNLMEIPDIKVFKNTAKLKVKIQTKNHMDNLDLL